MLLRAEILTQSQKYGQALKTLDELDQYDQHNLEAVLLRSDILLSQLRFDQAAQLLESESEFFEKKDKVEVLLELADVYDESEEFEAVYETLKRVIKIDRRNEEALQKICFWAEFNDKLEESVELFWSLTEFGEYSRLPRSDNGTIGACYLALSAVSGLDRVFADRNRKVGILN